MNTLPDFVVLDTCVLLSNVLRRLFLRLAHKGCFAPVWSEVIGDEWRRNAARLWEVAPEAIALQWEEMQAEFPEANRGDVSAFKQGLVHSDPKDWHVIAAGRAVLAKHPEASVAVVTRNLRDFRRSELRRVGLALLDPDQLLVLCREPYRPELEAALEQVPQDLVDVGRPLEPLEAILKRDRLFRLARLSSNSVALS